MATFVFGDKDKKLTTLPCFHPIKNHNNTLWVFLLVKKMTTVLFTTIITT
jgi:hypothetical protein